MSKTQPKKHPSSPVFSSALFDDADLITRVEMRLPDLSQAESSIARLLLEDPSGFSQMGVRDIASKIGVSEPTVVRFCRKVGCDGFRDLKFKLVQDVATRQAKDDALSSQIVSDSGTDDQENLDENILLDRCYQAAIVTLKAARSSLDAEAISNAADIIAGSQKVLVYGLGGSSAIMALEMSNRLFRLGVVSIAHVDSYVQRMSAATLGEDDAAIFLSSTGRPRPLLDAVELAKYYGASCIGIAPKNSALGKDMDFCLDVQLSHSGAEILNPNPMRFAQLLAIDAISFEVARRLGDSAVEQLNRIRASIAFLHGLVPQQPVGD